MLRDDGVWGCTAVLECLACMDRRWSWSAGLVVLGSAWPTGPPSLVDRSSPVPRAFLAAIERAASLLEKRTFGSHHRWPWDPHPVCTRRWNPRICSLAISHTARFDQLAGFPRDCTGYVGTRPGRGRARAAGRGRGVGWVQVAPAYPAPRGQMRALPVHTAGLG